VILQLVIENVTGMPYADYLQQAILDPLELDHTTFRFDATLQPQLEGNVAGSYERDESLWQVAPDTAGWGLFSSANDLAAFLAAHTDEAVLTEESIASLITPAEYTNRIYGMGYFTFEMGDGERVLLVHMLRHGGEGLIVAQPQTGEGLVILLNSNNGNIDQPLILIPILCAWDAWADEDFAWLCEEWGSPP
jgi:CubicO group peptidase (beta-lactamase class C family)